MRAAKPTGVVSRDCDELDRKLRQLEALLICPSLDSMTEDQRDAFCSLGADLAGQCRAMLRALEGVSA